MTRTQIEAILRLFKGYVLENESEKYSNTTNNESLIKGLVYDNMVVPEEVKEIAETMYGKKPEEWNATFHKSFSTVRDTPIEELVAQQLIHYFTTYGLEELGLYNSDLVYIPNELLEIPELTESVPLAVIHCLTEEQLKEKLLVLVTSGIALSKETVQDVLTLSDYIDKDKFDDITNREVKTTLYDKYKIAPKNNVEFLRYIVYKATGNTLLIKDKATYKAIKDADINTYKDYLINYVNKAKGYEKLAEIFLRYKMLFLAFKREPIAEKHNEELMCLDPNILVVNRIINKISKLSSKYHIPVKQNILDRLTTISTKKEIKDNKDLIIDKLKQVTPFRETRITNAIKYKNSDAEWILYKIRNGKGYVQQLDTTINVTKDKAQKELYDLVYNHLADRLKEKLAGKKVYMPQDIMYTVPTSEKQFNGNIPEGSYIEVSRKPEANMVIGIHWKNTGGRVDLDLSAQNRQEQISWNRNYRSDSSEFYFSGDVTDAAGENGATEVFYIGKNIEEKSFLITVCNYSSPNNTIPFEFLVAETNSSSINSNYTVDPNKVLLTLPKEFKYDTHTHEFDCRQMVVGFVKITSEYVRFYFNDFSLGQSIVTRDTNLTKGAYNYLETYNEVQLKLKDLLTKCNVEFLEEPIVETFEEVKVKNENGEEEILYKKITKKPDIDLSLNNIDKTTLIDLLGGI